MIENVAEIDKIIGRTVLSRETGDKLGKVQDLYIDPAQGLVLGATIEAPNGKLGGIDFQNIYSFGKDAVMATSENAIVPLEKDWVEQRPHAKKNLLGTNIVTEGGDLLGEVANIFVHLTAPAYAIYEVRGSLMDKLLGRSFFIYADSVAAVSSNAERIIVANDAAENAATSLSELLNHRNTAVSDNLPQRENQGMTDDRPGRDNRVMNDEDMMAERAERERTMVRGAGDDESRYRR